jgi:hypothetical protein
MLIITPLPALLPIALMVLGPALALGRFRSGLGPGAKELQVHHLESAV